MMINKRLIGTVPDSKPYIAGNVALQWLSLLSNAGMIFSCAWFLQQLLEGAAAPRTLALPLAAGLAAVLVRGICTVGAGRMSFLAARSVKRTLRRSIYEKLLRLGPAYSQNVATSEAVQLAAEGVEQLETYFGAYLPQFFYLFRGTVAENLRMARPDADDASLWDVLERVRLAGFLRGERGLDTPLDAQGANLSGGQRQRLALARALLHDSPVYVFDEATSNIDVESENDIMAEIRALARRRTVIVITHRLANVTDADSIYVLEAGTVAGHGPHAALLAQGGLYKTLWDRQQELEHFGTEEVSA